MLYEELVTKAPAAERNWPQENPPPAEDALRVLGLVKTFMCGFWRRAVPAVRGVSFVLPRGRVTALLGHNGAGKTTTLSCILGLIRADAGEIAIYGRDHRDCTARRRVGYLPEHPSFYDHLSARELLEFYAALLEIPARDRDRRIAELLDRVGLAPQAGTVLRKYSKGMLQRVGLAQALLGEPELLILDEPMSGLDPIGRREVRELLRAERERGTAILLSSHIVPDVETLADEALFLREGLLVGEVPLARTAAVEFLVRPARQPSAAALAALTGDGHPTDGGAPGAPPVLTAPDPQTLARLLEACSAESIDVLDVNARRTNLEDLFLRAMGSEGEAEC